MAGISFRNVNKHYGAVRAVDDVSFDIADGEFVCLLGPSGCGKTTTLRLIAGLETATSGAITMNGRDVTHAPPKDRDIGMVFQDYALYPHMTIAENIAYPLKVRGIDTGARRARAEEVAQSLQISQLLDRRPGQISGGQQQRSSVARALIHKPQIFLFDEPLSNLDAKLRLEARSFIKHLQKKLGVTSVYVTHDQAEAMALADRIAVMSGGRIVQMAPPLEVYRRPATLFVAGFLGSPPMNLLPARLIRTPNGPHLVGAGFDMGVGPEYQNVDLPDGASVVAGLRPEHLEIVEPDTPYAITGEVYAIEPLGPESLVTVTVNGTLVSVRLFSDEVPTVSGRIGLRADPARLHLFHESGERIQ